MIWNKFQCKLLKVKNSKNSSNDFYIKRALKKYLKIITIFDLGITTEIWPTDHKGKQKTSVISLVPDRRQGFQNFKVSIINFFQK